MDFEDFIMRLLLILVCTAGPVLLLSGEAAVIKVMVYEMFETDLDLWDPLLFFNSFIKI